MSATTRSLVELLPADALDAGGARDREDRARATGGRAPESVVRPGSTEEVAALLSWASREGVGVLPVGSGRGAAAVTDDRPYVVLATDRLAGIAIYEPADLTLTADAGTSFRTVADALGAEGQWAPFDPPFVLDRTLGGLVARGESGALWMGYGEVRNHVLGATVVTGDGRTLRLGGRVVKNVAGYDLLKAIVGSRGTLAVITSVCIRAFPRPPVDRLLVVRGDSLHALADVAAAVRTAPVMPVSCVLTDRVEARAVVGGWDGSGESGGPGGAGRSGGSRESRGTGGSGRSDGRAVAGPALLVRLHGAPATVDADRATLEAHVGMRFEVVGGDGDAARAERGSPDGPSSGVNPDIAAMLLATMRDHAASDPVVVEASARPSRLRDLLAALDPLSPEALMVDGYAGRVRLGSHDLDPAAVAAARAAVERLGGALRVVRDRTGRSTGAGLGSAPSPDEAAITSRLQRIFDPEGVLWPTRE